MAPSVAQQRPLQGQSPPNQRGIAYQTQRGSMNIQTVGVIGAGVMGRGVAQSLAQTNHQVILVDVVESALDQALDEIQQNARFSAFFQPTSDAIPVEDLLQRITPTTEYAALQAVDFVIEKASAFVEHRGTSGTNYDFDKQMLDNMS